MPSSAGQPNRTSTSSGPAYKSSDNATWSRKKGESLWHGLYDNALELQATPEPTIRFNLFTVRKKSAGEPERAHEHHLGPVPGLLLTSGSLSGVPTPKKAAELGTLLSAINPAGLPVG